MVYSCKFWIWVCLGSLALILFSLANKVSKLENKVVYLENRIANNVITKYDDSVLMKGEIEDINNNKVISFKLMIDK